MTRRIHTLIELIWDPVSRQYKATSKESYLYNGPIAHAAGSPILEHTDWGFFDDGTESGSVIIGAKNTDPDLEVDTIYLYRAGVEETGGTKWNNGKIQLQYNHNGGGFNNVDDVSSVVQSIATGNIADGDNTTQRLTSFTYITNNGCFDEVDGSAGGGQYDPNNSGAEGLFSFQIIGADVSASDTIVLKVINGTTTADFDVYNQTDPTITVSAAAAYAITGDVTVNSTIASGMDFTLNAAITGDVTVNSTIASTMAYNQNPIITGNVIVNTTIAAGMTYGASYTITGDVTVNSTIAASMAYNQNPSITGDVTVNSTIAAGMAYTLNASITGDVTIDSTIASGMVYQGAAGDYQITGDVTINSTIASDMDYTLIAAIIGDVTVNTTIASAMDYTLNASITGDVTINSTIAASMDYQGESSINGDVTVNTTIAAAMAYNQHAAIVGAVTVNTTIAAGMLYEEGGFEYQITGDVTINSTIASGMAFTLIAAIVGDVTVNTTIASAMVYAPDVLPITDQDRIIIIDADIRIAAIASESRHIEIK